MHTSVSILSVHLVENISLLKIHDVSKTQNDQQTEKWFLKATSDFLKSKSGF